MTELEKIVKQHEDMIYPIVRVRHEKVGGSGIIIYSALTPNREGEWETYLLTCHHVVESAIKIVKKWSSLARRQIDEEDRAYVQAEVFEYEELSRIIGASSYNAEIVAWDKDLDLALVKIRASKQFRNVARLYPKGTEDEIKLGVGTCACGCSLGHEPILNYGNLTAKHDIIENKEYWLSTANTIFGNSGGAEFLETTREFIGITARVSGVQLGFGLDIITWMGFFIPITSVYKFLDDQIFQFIYDRTYTSARCEELRKKKQDEEERKLMIPPTGISLATT